MAPPQVTLQVPPVQVHFAESAQVTSQVPALQVTSHVALPLQVTFDAGPTVSAQVLLPPQVDRPELVMVTLQVALPAQANSRSTPARPEHADESAQVTLEPFPTSSAQVLPPLQVCTQPPVQVTVHAPEGQVQIDSFEQLQVSPAQICGTGTQPATLNPITSSRVRMARLSPNWRRFGNDWRAVERPPGGGGLRCAHSCPSPP